MTETPSPYLLQPLLSQRARLLERANRQRSIAVRTANPVHAYRALELARAYERALTDLDQQNLALNAHSPLPPVTLQTCMQGPYTPDSWAAEGWPEERVYPVDLVTMTRGEIEAQITNALEAMRPIFEAAPSAGRDLPVVTLNAAE